jgi:hypothetical protein
LSQTVVAHRLEIMSAGVRREVQSERARPATASPLRAVDAAYGPAPGRDARTDLILRADALGIPWEQILLEEIRAEEGLRRYLEDVEGEWPLAAALGILPSTFLRSWRVRNRLQNLSAQARAAQARSARGDLRRAFEQLGGKNEADRTTLAEHLWFAYQRILLLQRVSRAAAASRGGTPAERLAFICTRARCCYDDAAWAASTEDSPRPGHRLDAAIRKVREEGFQIPRAATEAHAFAALRRIVRASPALSRRRRSRKTAPNRDGVPHRLPLSDGVG